MNTSINLLLHRDEELLREKKKFRILNFVIAASLIGVGLISLSIFLLTQAVNSSSVKKDEADILKKISQFENKQIKLFIVNNRVENIDKIIKAKKDLSKTASDLLAKIPENLLVDSFEVSDAMVIITGRSKSLFTIGEFINNLTDMVSKKEIIKSLTLNSLVLDGVGNSYTVSIKSEL